MQTLLGCIYFSTDGFGSPGNTALLPWPCNMWQLQPRRIMTKRDRLPFRAVRILQPPIICRFRDLSRLPPGSILARKSREETAVRSSSSSCPVLWVGWEKSECRRGASVLRKLEAKIRGEDPGVSLRCQSFQRASRSDHPDPSSQRKKRAEYFLLWMFYKKKCHCDLDPRCLCFYLDWQAKKLIHLSVFIGLFSAKDLKSALVFLPFAWDLLSRGSFNCLNRDSIKHENYPSVISLQKTPIKNKINLLIDSVNNSGFSLQIYWKHLDPESSLIPGTTLICFLLTLTRVVNYTHSTRGGTPFLVFHLSRLDAPAARVARRGINDTTGLKNDTRQLVSVWKKWFRTQSWKKLVYKQGKVVGLNVKAAAAATPVELSLLFFFSGFRKNSATSNIFKLLGSYSLEFSSSVKQALVGVSSVLVEVNALLELWGDRQKRCVSHNWTPATLLRSALLCAGFGGGVTRGERDTGRKRNMLLI